ncbi:MAG TPA: hypothetical protein VFX11_16195, partial [Candidatus Kapabacteria bacterium]|nr:hypothetical protein [Candidatus Kapabacteria bacterium]
MFSTRINSILLAEADQHAQRRLCGVLQRLAPQASVQVTTSVAETCEVLTQTPPVLAVINFTLIDGNFIDALKSIPRLPLPPFLLGLTRCPDCAETVYAMRYGFNHVLQTAANAEQLDEVQFAHVLTQMVSEPAPLEATIGKLVNPLLYNQMAQFDLKQVSGAIEQHIFSLAS